MNLCWSRTANLKSDCARGNPGSHFFQKDRKAESQWAVSESACTKQRKSLINFLAQLWGPFQSGQEWQSCCSSAVWLERRHGKVSPIWHTCCSDAALSSSWP